MKTCQGTFNYIFSNHSFNLLQDLQLLQPTAKKKETQGYIAKDIWVKTPDNKDFCIEFREIVNEEDFLLSHDSSVNESISPGFFEEKNLRNEPVILSQHYQLKGIIIEDSVAARKQAEEWSFPCPIFWAQSSAIQDLYHQLSYKKKFPLWAILLEINEPNLLKNLNEVLFNNIEFQNKQMKWLHMETTAWDFLISIQ
ncbi:MAG: hypothetical protein ACXVCP_01900 [Bdellovibrio sp.]